MILAVGACSAFVRATSPTNRYPKLNSSDVDRFRGIAAKQKVNSDDFLKMENLYATLDRSRNSEIDARTWEFVETCLRAKNDAQHDDVLRHEAVSVLGHIDAPAYHERVLALAKEAFDRNDLAAIRASALLVLKRKNYPKWEELAQKATLDSSSDSILRSVSEKLLNGSIH